MKRLFLTGPIGAGKSSLIRKALGDSINKAGGFVTERIIEDGVLVGFDLVNLDTDSSLSRLRFLTFKSGNVCINDEVFSEFVPRILQEATKKPFVVLDEIGGFEILIPEFVEAFDKLIESDIPCIGVLKALPSAEKISRVANLKPGFIERAEDFYSQLSTCPDTEILQITTYKDKHSSDILLEWKEKYANDVDSRENN